MTKETKIKVGICMPHTGSIKGQTAFAMFRLLRHSDVEIDMFLRSGSILHYSRESLVKYAKEADCTHILFIDSDMFFDADALTRLLARDKDIIGVHYNMKKLPLVTTVGVEPPVWEKAIADGVDILECTGVATGFMLIKAEVFDKIDHPWFFWKSDDKGEVVMGEDHWFCHKATEAGFKIWADLSIKVGHIGDYIY